jgi:hypothetical protein
MQYNIGPNNKRLAELDYIRVLALLLMVIAHSTVAVEVSSSVAKLIRHFGHIAPAFFFFAFGITDQLFLRKKPIGYQLRGNAMLFCIAICHNFFMSNIFLINEFFFFLWICQFLLIVFRYLNNDNPSNKRLLLYTFFILALMVLLPFKIYLFAVSEFLKGPFPFPTWGLFITSGIIFARCFYEQNDAGTLTSDRRVLKVAILIILASLVLFLAGNLLELKSLDIKKGPLSPTFVTFFTGISIVIVVILKYSTGMLARLKVINQTVVFLSKNLLLATVLHYTPVMILARVLPSADGIYRFPYGYLKASLDWIAYIGVSLTAFLMLILIVGMVKYLWLLRMGKRFELLFQKHGEAIILFITCVVVILAEANRAGLFVYTGVTFNIPSSWLELYEVVFRESIKIFSYLVMIFAALQMTFIRKIVRNPLAKFKVDA